MTHRTHSRDAGFTLSELLVAVTLLGIVLAAIYAATNAMLVAGRQSEAQSVFARDSGEPLRLLEKALMQNSRLTNTETYTVTFLTDRNLDALNEKVKVSVDSSRRLRYEEWQLNSIGQEQLPKRRDWYLSTNCDNRSRWNPATGSTGVPLLIYWVADSDGAMDADGSSLYDPLPPEQVRSLGINARKVTIQLCLKAYKQEFRTDREILFRNRDY